MLPVKIFLAIDDTFVQSILVHLFGALSTTSARLQRIEFVGWHRGSLTDHSTSVIDFADWSALTHHPLSARTASQWKQIDDILSNGQLLARPLRIDFNMSPVELPGPYKCKKGLIRMLLPKFVGNKELAACNGSCIFHK